MRLTLTDGPGEYLGPTCVPLLYGVKDNPLHTDEVGILHPLGAYNTSFAPVQRNLNRVLDQIAEIKSLREPPDSEMEDLYDKYQNMLYAVVEHFETVEKISKCFVASDDRKNNKPLKNFNTNHKIIRDHTARIVNAIKHNHNRLVPIHSRNNFFGAHGYYVAAPRSHNTIGPNKDIHKEYKDIETAFSFNQDIRKIFVSLFEASENLRIFIEAIGHNTRAVPDQEDDILFQIAEKVSSLPMFYFMDEKATSGPFVRTSNDSGQRAMIIDSKSPDARATLILGEIQTRIFLKGDGSTKSFILPYFRDESERTVKSRLL